MDTAETVLKMLESVLRTETVLTEMLATMNERNERERERNDRERERNEQRYEDLTTFLAAMDARIAEDHRHLGDILKYVAETCQRQEQMTAQILMGLSTRKVD